MEASQNTSLIKHKKSATGPGVYVLKRKDQPLYIGCTSNLAKRPYKRDKGHSSRWAAILEANNVELIPCDSLNLARQLEKKLVPKLKPKYNQRLTLGPADLERTWQIIRENW